MEINGGILSRLKTPDAIPLKANNEALLISFSEAAKSELEPVVCNFGARDRYLGGTVADSTTDAIQSVQSLDSF
jgi:hypothetical protein